MADPTPIHRHPVGQVQRESGLSRAAFYKRMAQAGVRPLRVGQNSFLEREHLEALRALDDHIQAGGKPESFPGRLQTLLWSLLQVGASEVVWLSWTAPIVNL